MSDFYARRISAGIKRQEPVAKEAGLPLKVYAAIERGTVKPVPSVGRRIIEAIERLGREQVNGSEAR